MWLDKCGAELLGNGISEIGKWPYLTRPWDLADCDVSGGAS